MQAASKMSTKAGLADQAAKVNRPAMTQKAGDGDYRSPPINRLIRCLQAHCWLPCSLSSCRPVEAGRQNESLLCLKSWVSILRNTLLPVLGRKGHYLRPSSKVEMPPAINACCQIECDIASLTNAPGPYYSFNGKGAIVPGSAAAMVAPAAQRVIWAVSSRITASLKPLRR